MKISIANFKSIKVLNEFSLKPLTILSGTNSSGKSSFIQFLLLIKQTLDLDSSNYQLALDEEMYKVREYIDLLHGKLFKNKLKAGLLFDKSEMMNSIHRIEIFDTLEYSCYVEFTYDDADEKPYITEFSISFLLEDDQKKEGQFVRFVTSSNKNNPYKIQTNNELFVKGLRNSKANIEKINYSGIYPISYEIFEITTGESPKGNTLKDEKLVRYFSDLDPVKDIIDSFFKNISYIGPLRESPRDAYNIKGRHKYVGSKGEYVAEVLYTLKDEIIEFYKPTFTNEGVQYSLEKNKLLKSVSFWFCDVFRLGKEIKIAKFDDTYSIVIVSNSGIETTIKHVGFGISQILPIVVEGLKLSRGSTLILEQPEIHLHPKLQSLLFDFLRSLLFRGVSVLVETHSDHFITRLRRRIVEDLSNKLAKEINLTFIENVNDDIIFRTLEMDETGSLDYFPQDFMEQTNIESKAIIKAQIKKRNQIKTK